MIYRETGGELILVRVSVVGVGKNTDHISIVFGGRGTRTGDLNRAQGLDSAYSNGRGGSQPRVNPGMTALALGKTHTQACSGQ